MTNTNDHVAPQMYLRRFGRPTSNGHQVCAAPAERPEDQFTTSTRNVGAEKGFYWGSGPDGVPHHDMERFLTKVEDLGAPAFRRLLDDGQGPTDDALPRRWPPRPDVRAAVSWWLAAQILRTAPQRDRLWRMQSTVSEPPRELARANLHLQAITEGVAPLAHLLNARPWGIGLTSLCLLTSDSPVQILNARDDDDPLRAATFWDVYIPLDPHRFLYLPGRMHQSEPALMRDHRINLPGGLAIALNQSVVETAHRQVIWHPSHDPRPHIDLRVCLSMRRSRNEHGGTGNVISYDTLRGDEGVQRRWLEQHTWDNPDDAATPAEEETTPEQAQALVQSMLGRLERARAAYESNA